MPKTRRLPAWRLLPAALLALAACSHGSSSGAILLGAAGPWNQPEGIMNRKGMELAQEELRAAGKPIDIDFENDSAKGTVATGVAKHFVDTNVVAVIGHVNSGAMSSAAKIYDGNLAAVATTASSPSLTGISKWTFRVISSDSVNGLTMGKFASDHGKRRAAILYENDAYGRGLMDAFRHAFTGEIISADPVDAEDPKQTFEPYVSFYKSRKPDVVFMASTGDPGIAFVREARKQGLDAWLMGGDGWTVLATMDSTATNGVYVGAPFTSEAQRPEVQKFVQAFKRKYNMLPDANAALGYDATMLLATAATAVNAHGKSDRAAVRDYLAAISPDHPFAGVTGNISFSAGGDPVGKGIVMTRISHGTLAEERN